MRRRASSRNAYTPCSIISLGSIRCTLLVDAALSPDDLTLVTAGFDGNLQFWDLASSKLMWTLRAHNLFASGVHFEGASLISRSASGELARWEVPTPAASPGWLARFDRLLRGAPLVFDEHTGGVVTRSPRTTPHRS